MADDKDGIPIGITIEAFNNAVRDTAYFLWEQDGRPEGRGEEYWQRALKLKVREMAANEWMQQEPAKKDPARQQDSSD